MLNRPAHIRAHQDEAALRIGGLYREGRQSYINAGRLLHQQKESMPPGAWTTWLKTNEKALGFGVSTANRLMRWARCPNMEPEAIWQSGEHGESARAGRQFTEDMRHR